MEVIRAHGATLAGVLVRWIVRNVAARRDFPRFREVERDYGCKVISIITLKDLIYLEEKPDMAEHLAAVREHTGKNLACSELPGGALPGLCFCRAG